MVGHALLACQPASPAGGQLSERSSALRPPRSPVFIFATYVFLEMDSTTYFLYDGGISRVVPVVLCILVGLYFQDLYPHIHVKSWIVLIQQLCLVMGVAFLAQGLIAYPNSNLRVPIFVMLVGSTIAIVAIFGWRLLFSTFAFQLVVGHDRLLLVGGSSLLERHRGVHRRTPGDRPGDRGLFGRPARAWHQVPPHRGRHV